MKLRLLAPFRSHFRLTLAFMAKTGQLSTLSEDYLKFWNDAARRISDGENAPLPTDANEIEFLHSMGKLSGSDEPLYTRIDTDAVRYTARSSEFVPSMFPTWPAFHCRKSLRKIAFVETPGHRHITNYRRKSASNREAFLFAYLTTP